MLSSKFHWVHWSNDSLPRWWSVPTNRNMTGCCSWYVHFSTAVHSEQTWLTRAWVKMFLRSITAICYSGIQQLKHRCVVSDIAAPGVQDIDVRMAKMTQGWQEDHILPVRHVKPRQNTLYIVSKMLLRFILKII